MSNNGHKPASLSKPFRNRITGSGSERVDQLLANPANWRLHPDNQQQALAGAIDDIGFIRSVTVNRTTGCVLDGHLRVTLAARSGVDSLPVEYVELSEAEEAEALLTLDPIGAMAAADKTKLKELMRSVQSDDARVQQMLERIGILGGIIPPVDYTQEWQGMPEFEQEDLQGIIIRVHFETKEDRRDFFQRIGQKFTDKTNSIWYPERPENIKNQLGNGLVYTDES